jgi:ketosteroid isomerase-like protein
MNMTHRVHRTGVRVIPVVALVVALAVTAWQPLLAATPLEQEVLSFEIRRCDTLMHRDVAALATMLTDDVTYVHASGLKQGKADYLDYVAAGNVNYQSYRIHDTQVQVMGDAAVTHGLFDYINGAGKPGSMFYTAVYVRNAGQWRLAAWQSTIRKVQ